MSTPSKQSSVFTKRLQETRRWRDLSQEELGRRAGLNGAAISHFETGTRKPSFENLRRLADTLSVTLDYLTGRTDEPTSTGQQTDQLFRDLNRMSSEDQDFLRRMASDLARRSEHKGE